MDTVEEQQEQPPVRISKLTGKPVQSRHYVHGVGAPTKYKPEYAHSLLEYFQSAPTTKLLQKTYIGKKGVQVTEDVEVANCIPFFERFAHSIGVTTKCMWEWKDKYPEFSKAYAQAQEIQKTFLIENGLLNRYNAQFAIFTAKNITDMRDKIDVDITQDIKIEVIGYDPDVLPPGRSGKQLPKAQIVDV